jgi:CO/xanthine dehydrogenase Mo-binding subunit
MGQASDTSMAQIVAEVLGVKTAAVKVSNPDTDMTPYDMATLGSRSVYHMGKAVKLAAEDAKNRLEKMATDMQMTAPYHFRDVFIKHYGMQAGSIVGYGSFIPTYTSPDKKDGSTLNATPFWMSGATGVELSIDTETGHITIDRLINVVDCGNPINPEIVQTQISGAAIMQLGFSLTEKMNLDSGQVTNASFADYKIPGFNDIPLVMENEAVKAYQIDGPFGAKGVGESATFGVSPAIANAIEDAVGVRINELPMTPELIFMAMRKAQNKS